MRSPVNVVCCSTIGSLKMLMAQKHLALIGMKNREKLITSNLTYCI